MGEDVFTIGYPPSRLLGNDARLSKGLINSTAVMRDDPSNSRSRPATAAR
jgi:serine protease Do